MTVGIGAAGFVGIGIEDAGDPGVYVPPTKFFPIRSESLSWTQNTVLRRVIRGTTDPIGAVPGNGNVEGDIDMEMLDDVLPYFLLCARGTITKTGTGPFVYTFRPHHRAVPDRTMSITVVRNDVVFGYTGCVVGSQSYSVDDGMAVKTLTLLGREEETQAAPTPAYNPDDMPYGAGTWFIEIPTETQVFDSDNFSLEIDDGAEVQNRLINRRGAAFISYGERNTTLSVDRDFEDRAEYDHFKALTNRAITVRTEKSENAKMRFNVPGSIVESYEANLSGVGDLIRSSTTYQGIHEATVGGAYEIEITTDEDVTEITAE